jgi:hypothetical protein
MISRRRAMLPTDHSIFGHLADFYYDYIWGLDMIIFLPLLLVLLLLQVLSWRRLGRLRGSCEGCQRSAPVQQEGSSPVVDQSNRFIKVGHHKPGVKISHFSGKPKDIKQY